MPMSLRSSLELSSISGVILDVCWALENAFFMSPSARAASYSSLAFSLRAILSSMVPDLSSFGLPSNTKDGSMPASMRLAVR